MNTKKMLDIELGKRSSLYIFKDLFFLFFIFKYVCLCTYICGFLVRRENPSDLMKLDYRSFGDTKVGTGYRTWVSHKSKQYMLLTGE